MKFRNLERSRKKKKKEEKVSLRRNKTKIQFK